MNLWSGSREGHGLAAALTNPTELSFKKGTVHHHDPVRFRRADDPNAEAAYRAWKERVGWRDLPALEALVTEMIACKLQQHPRLRQAIATRGGVPWLATCRHHTSARPTSFQRWEGVGHQSAFIRALIAAYEHVQGGMSCTS